jgi:UDP-N-acetylglucosamine 2-epimerase (non-hydrolysing)
MPPPTLGRRRSSRKREGDRVSSLRIVTVVGCRPNFMKVAPLVTEMRRQGGVTPIVVHTGQHRGHEMSDVFFKDLDLPRPDVHLGVDAGPQTEQLARIALAFSPVVRDLAPDLVLVVGDVTSTLACALTAQKAGIPVAHVEAGLRSFDREMPEEINRLLTDQVADLLFASEWSGVHNLEREGIPRRRIFFVGNVMIDTLLASTPKIAASDAVDRLGLTGRRYAVLTLHRPSNVDDPRTFARLVHALEQVQAQIAIVFPIHPRTARQMETFDLGRRLLALPGIHAVQPLGYVDFVRLVQDATLVLTDSGGVQEESTMLRVPCLTLRENTERPATVTHGTNRLVGTEPERIASAVSSVLHGVTPAPRRPDLWDGQAAVRIVQVLVREQEWIRDLYRSTRERNPCKPISTVA